ncbi:MAG: 50S ribosomal protein L9 [Hirschia sp.]|nr:50S ribosomal protein L9 [Hirschia sp.]MBF20046.1 50S ribosomal protein L9 [Hirschia sp.]|tara:strand:+ start:284 stop:874 length:591 start_codon:yes stop_codon:yes gene_type:complete
MDVILLERVNSLGSIGDVVSVKNGFARNFLLPQGKALLANAANKARFEAERDQIEARNAAARQDAESFGKVIDGSSYVIIRQSSDSGFLYGSVTARDVAEAAKENGHEIQKLQVVLPQPIKALGLHTIAIRLHPELEVSVQVNIARSADEAERQAEGVNVIEAAMEEERAEDAARAAEMASIAAEVAAERGPSDDD